MDVKLKCQCGAVQGIASGVSARSGTRLVCYCDDCQAFARNLGRQHEVLDARGGTDIYQLTPAQLTITDGAALLRCMRLTPRGLYRWYTDCCKTPVANVVSAKVPLVGVLHSFLDDAGSRDENLGPVRYRVMGKFALEGPSDQVIHEGFPLVVLFRVFSRILLAKLRGRSRPTPFFDAGGMPVSEPEIWQSLEDRSEQ